ncbi:MAG TPA: hypothetical protein VK808_08315 [Bacteroidia bacterium]|nr:hypothetical protein [Bacteroidia bacterium]
MPDGQFQLAITDIQGNLQCIINFAEGFMTVDPSGIVSEPAAVIMGDTAVASETGVIRNGTIMQILINYTI